MSTIRLQDAIGEIQNCYIEEAHAQPSHTQQNKTGGSARKLWLVAAIVAITALLVGCAAAVWLNLDDLRMQEVTYLADMRYERDGSKIPATEKTADRHHTKTIPMPIPRICWTRLMKFATNTA